jgi:hypothetical protein
VDGVCTHGLNHGLEKPEDYADMFVSDDLTASSDEDEDGDGLDKDEFRRSVHKVDVMVEADEGVDEEEEGYEDKDEVKSPNNPSKSSEQCDACRFPFFFLSELEAAVSEQHKERFVRAKAAARKKSSGDGHYDEDKPSDDKGKPSDDMDSLQAYVIDALKVINQCKDKFVFYMAHKQCVAQQQGKIRKIDGGMRSEVEETQLAGTSIVIIIDWKMKFENIAKK